MDDAPSTLRRQTKHYNLNAKCVVKTWCRGVLSGSGKVSGGPSVSRARPQRKPWGPILFLSGLSHHEASSFVLHAIPAAATWHLHHKPRSDESTWPQTGTSEAMNQINLFPCSWEWWLTCIIPLLRKLRYDCHEFKAILELRVNSRSERP